MFIKPHILIFTNVKILSIHIDFVKVAKSCQRRDPLLLFGRDLLFLRSAPVNFLLSNSLHGGLFDVLLLGFLWGSLLDGARRPSLSLRRGVS